MVSYETIREWGLRFGRLFANELKRRRPRPGDKWHLDEVFIRVQGKLQYLWRAVDQHGHVLDILGRGRVARPFGSALTDPGRRLSRTRLFPEVTRIGPLVVSTDA